MKVTLQRRKFAELFDIAASATSSTAKDVLGKVLLVVGQKAQLEASNGETSILVDCDFVHGDPGRVLLDPRRISPILKESSGDGVIIQTEGNTIEITTAEGSYSLASSDPSEFPRVKGNDGVSVSVASSTLLEALTLTSFAVDDKSTRYQLGGVLFQGSGQSLDVVATDGRRLSTVEVSCDQIDGLINSIVPSRPLGLLSRCLSDDGGQCEVSFDTSSASFRTGSVTLITRLVEGRYPNWKTVIPSSENCETITLQASAFAQAVKQASIVADQESRGVVFYFAQDNCGISARTADIGESAVNVPLVYTGSAKLTMDYRFVLDWFSRLPKGESVEMFFKGPGSPTLFVRGSAKYVVMPMERN